MPDNKSISRLSQRLFWDVDSANICWEKNSKFLVGRVLEYGLLEDWILLKKELGLDKIVEHAKRIRHLDDISHNFIATIGGVPKEEFRCYTTKQSQNLFWVS